MATETFFYTPVRKLPDRVDPKGAVFYRPFVPARISAPDGQLLDAFVLLDSGADYCLLPLSMASSLNIDVNRLPSTTTAGIGNDANVTYFQTIQFDLGGGVRFSARTGFCAGLNTAFIGVLGQQGFFDHFHVEFRLAEGIFTIEPAAPSAIH